MTDHFQNNYLFVENDQFRIELDDKLKNLGGSTEKFIKAQKKRNELNSTIIKQHYEQIKTIKKKIKKQRVV